MWHKFAYQGDEWIAAYACMPIQATSAKLFTIGHAVELYLKAAHIKLFGDMSIAIKFGHRLKDIWDTCKHYDPEFMKDYDLKDKVFAIDFFNSEELRTLSYDELKNYIYSQDLYIILKHLADLKYIGLPWKSRAPREIAFCYAQHDPIWIQFFRSIRDYIGYPPGNKTDKISQMLEMNALPETAAQYVRRLYKNPDPGGGKS